MAAYRRVYDSPHLTGSAPEPYARQSSMDCLFIGLTNAGERQHSSTETGVVVVSHLVQAVSRSSMRGGGRGVVRAASAAAAAPRGRCRGGHGRRRVLTTLLYAVLIDKLRDSANSTSVQVQPTGRLRRTPLK